MQNISIKQKSTLNYILAGFLAAVLFIGFLGYRNIRHKKLLTKQQDEIHHQRISELEKDKQLVAVDAMLKGNRKNEAALQRFARWPRRIIIWRKIFLKQYERQFNDNPRKHDRV